MTEFRLHHQFVTLCAHLYANSQILNVDGISLDSIIMDGISWRDLKQSPLVKGSQHTMKQPSQVKELQRQRIRLEPSPGPSMQTACLLPAVRPLYSRPSMF